MSKRIKVLVVVLAAVLLLTVGGTATVMAQEEPASTPQANGFLARVAEILDIPQEGLVDAFKLARQEMRQEACEECDQTRQQLRQAHQELRQTWQELRQGQQ